MSNASDCSFNSYSPDFKNYIEEYNGSSSLIYIRAHSIDHHHQLKQSLNTDELFRNEFKRMSLRQRDKGILSKFTSKKSKFDLKVVERNVYSHDNGRAKELKIRNISFKENKLPKPRLNDHRSLFEIIFNASLIIGPENRKFVIDKINQFSIFEKDLNVGDTIKSINGDLITVDNLNHILSKVITQKYFKIVAEESCKDEYVAMQEEIKITKVPDVVTFKDKLFQLETESHELIFSLNVIVKNEQISEDSDDYITVFSYPPKENNFLHKLKGSFLTIASIMKNTFNIYPRITNIKVHNTIFYVTYTIRNGGNEFIFLGFNSNYGGSFDATHLTKNFVKFLDYIYPNFIIMNDFEQLNSFCEIVKMQLIKKNSDAINFEQLFSCVKFVSLPKEIVLRINDALSELEAMDYRNWNESLMELFGKFSIIGSCLYFKNSLICSHFNEMDLENVDLFIRHMCLKFMFERCILKEVAIWQRVYPREYQSYNMENDSTRNKVFLLIVSNGNLIMCVLLEENSFNINPENIESQSSNYLINFLFEMKDVLDHLKMVGIENLAKIWINSAKRPLCKNPFEPEISKKNQLQLKNIKEESEDDESDRDFDSHIDGQSTRQSSSGGFENEDLIYKDFEDIIPQTLTFGADNVLFHFTNLDFKEGIMITSLCEKYCIPPNDLLVDIFRRGCLNIHNKLQNTIKFNQILSRENRISNNNKTAMLPKEQAMLCEVKWEKGILNFWIIGRLFGIKELYVCHDARTPQNMVEIAFRLAINCCG